MTQSPTAGLPTPPLGRALNRLWSLPHLPSPRATRMSRGTSDTPAFHHVQVANIAHQGVAPHLGWYLPQSDWRVPTSPLARLAILPRTGAACGLDCQAVMVVNRVVSMAAIG